MTSDNELLWLIAATVEVGAMYGQSAGEIAEWTHETVLDRAGLSDKETK